MPRNDKQKTLKHTVMVTAVAAALFASPLAANAAGMGKINVLSALGEPLRAELDITATREETISLSARVAPPEAFRQANLEYASVLASLRFTLEKRPDGKPYFKITSERPVSDPFIDMLVELSWSSGRLVREYAFLLDPPELKANTASGVVAAPAVTPAQPPAKSVAPAEPAALPAPPKKSESIAAQPPAPPAPAAKAAPAEAGASSHEVKSGDTLSKIAKEYAVEGATLNQMLVALFNSNRDAFSGNNMNRLRAGKILNIPDAATVAAVDTAEARKIVVAQTADFNAYRNAVAGAAEQQAPSEGQAAQSSTGKIAPKVEDAAPAEAGKDKLQVSRGAEAGSAGKPSEEDRIAREKALKEANSRVAELEKNLTDLKQLAEMKSQAAGAPAAAGGTTPPAAQQPAPAAPQPGAAPAPAPAAPPENQLPPQKAKPPVTANALPPPSFIEENPALVFGGGAAILALLGLLGYRSWKRKREDAIDRDEGATLNEPATSLFGATSTSDSVDRTTGGLSNFSHATLDAADTGKSGVDPIQEAEVYMAYGRDIQAEEILRDALAKDPANIAIVSKLLEIYAARKSVAQFNELAVDLHDRTSGNGSAWTKAAELGRSIDPENPLYGGAIAPVVEDLAALEMPAVAEPVEPPLAEETIDKDELPEIIDFDLDLDAPAEAGGSTPDTSGGLDFDLDLGDDQSQAPQEERAAGDLDIDLEAPPAPDNVIDFDLGGGEPANDAEPAAPPLDLSSISLDLDNVAPSGSDSSEVASKLELAQAYEEMGDREGARELLQEVIAEGSPAQQESARKKLAELE